MSSTSMDEDEPILPMLSDENNENYKETCDNEVNDMIPRLERLTISDNEPMHASSDNMDRLGSSMNTITCSTNNFEGALVTDSSKNIYPLLRSAVSGTISVNEDTKVAVGSQISISGTEEISQVFTLSTQANIQSQDVSQNISNVEINMNPVDTKEEKILYTPKESKQTRVESTFDEGPLDLSQKCSFHSNNATKSSYAVSENKAEISSLIIVPEKKKRVDSETGEILEYLSILESTSTGTSPESGKDTDNKSKKEALDQFFDKLESGIDFDSSKLSYSADISSDDQSNRSSGIILDSPPDTPDIGDVNAASDKDNHSRKIAAFVPSVSRPSETRNRPFSTFQPQSNVTDASKINSSSDEDGKNSRTIEKNNSICYRRKSRKTNRLFPRPVVLDHSDVTEEEKRPSPGKRKTSLSENVSETAGKFRKRSISEHNSETGEKNSLVIRSRSLSPDLKNIESASFSNLPTENSVLQSRKRTNSDGHIASRVKFRRPSSSSDDAENK